MNSKKMLSLVSPIIFIAGFVLTGCSQPTQPSTDSVVNLLVLDGKVTAPTRGTSPNTTAINTTQYTGAVAWHTETGTAVSGNFAASTIYKAVVTLSVKNGYTLNGVAENSFTYTGATTVTNAANSSIVTITFPKTAAQSYGINLSQSSTYSWDGTFQPGYTQPTTLTVTVTNTSTVATGGLSVALSGTNAASFTLGSASIISIAVGGTATFTVQPKAGLGAGIHTAMVTVSGENGITASFNVSFTVSLPALNGTVTINGTPKVGKILTAVTEGLTGQVGTLHYQWKVDEAAVGTDQSTYCPVIADLNKTITVTVTSSGNSGSVTSGPTTAVSLAVLTDQNIELVIHLGALSANTASTPHTVILAPITINNWDFSSDGVWATVNNTVQNSGKYVILDLSDCSVWGNQITGSDSPSGNFMNIIKDNQYITGIILPDNLISIGDNAFLNCNKLTSLAIPNSVTSIGKLTFSGCTKLTSLIIPDSVTSIGMLAFENCSRLASLNIPTGITSIGYGVYKGCSNLTSMTIPAGVMSIGANAFERCTGLANLTIPLGVTSIDGGAFYGCTGLTSLNIPSSITSIGIFAFSECTGLTNLTISQGVTSIGTAAFSGCTGLTSLNIPPSVISIGSTAFYNCTGLTSLNIPSSITSIEGSAFGSCIGLTSLTIPNSVTSIGREAFFNCSGLTSISIPGSVTSIGTNAFYSCTVLTRVTFGVGSNISSANFGDYAFPEGAFGYGGNVLKTVYLGASPSQGTYTRLADSATWAKQ